MQENDNLSLAAAPPRCKHIMKIKKDMIEQAWKEQVARIETGGYKLPEDKADMMKLNFAAGMCAATYALAKSGLVREHRMLPFTKSISAETRKINDEINGHKHQKEYLPHDTSK